MKTHLQSIAAVFLLAAATVPLIAHAADASPDQASPTFVAAIATAAEDYSGCPYDRTLTPLQRRLLLKYDRAPESLMQYVWITRSIYLLDRMETAQWAESYRHAHPKW
jgi:hypothetical protein